MWNSILSSFIVRNFFLVGLESTSQEEGLLPVGQEDIFPELTAPQHTTSTPKKSNGSGDMAAATTISEETDVKLDICMLLLSREESQQIGTMLQDLTPPPEMTPQISDVAG